MRLDYHMHTMFSDGAGEMAKYVDRAARKKIDEIGFSDHIHLRKGAWSMDSAPLADYTNAIRRLGETSRIPLKAGLEVEFVPGKVEGLLRVIDEVDIDYLIGSVHYIGHWLFDNERHIQEWKRRDVDQVYRQYISLFDSERHIQEWKRRDVDQVYRQYISLVETMAKTRLFDIVGHLDLVRKFSFRPKNDLNDLMIEAVKVIRDCGMCVEVNTCGLREPCHEVYPSEKLLKMCFDYGLPITFGSDAHSPQDVGADFEKAVRLVKAIGYDEIVRFTRRKRDFIRL